MNNERLSLLKKYLNQETSPEENKLIQRYFLDHKLDEHEEELMYREWLKTSEENEHSIDADKSWKHIQSQIPNAQTDRIGEKKQVNKYRIWIAASIVTIIFLVTFYSKKFEDKIPQTKEEKLADFVVKETDKGEKLKLLLPDGTSIKLNASSVLRIPADYNLHKERIVYLEGEAFFKVARDKKRLFRVVTGDMVTEVLGTSFNVKTIEENLSVAVITGKVKVSNKELHIILHPDEMTQVRALDEKISKMAFNKEEVIGWKDNILFFNEVRFKDVINRLEQWYGVEFEITGKPPSDQLYSGKFEDKSLQLVLEGLGFSSEFNFEIKDKKVYINFKS